MGVAPVYTLYAVWEANTNRLIFNGNGATSGGMDEMSIKTDESTSLTDCGFAKIGYSFKGWATENNGSVKYTNKATYIMGAESSYTLYAVWQINQYTITLELNGGTASKNSITQDYNSVVDSLVATRSGYDFVEWYADSDFATVYNFSTMPAEDITVYAKWQIDTTYTDEIGIRNIQELQAINEYLSGKFYLENNIDANGFDFTPLGSKETPFTGAFDGNNKVVSNLSILGKFTYAGLFGSSKAKIKNIWVTNANYNVEADRVGGIVGFATSTIENCHWNGIISSSNGTIGGIVGYGINVSRCSVDGSISAYNTLVNVGGIAGLVSTIDNCYCNIAVKTRSTIYVSHPSFYKNSYVGGYIAAGATAITNSFVSNKSSYFMSVYNNTASTSISANRICREGTIENSFVITSGKSYVSSDGCSYINIKEISSRYYMNTQYNWSNEIWCWGYDYPILYSDDYIKVNYIGVDGLNNDNNPDGYKKNSDGFVLSSIAKDGYAFDGWYSDSTYKTKVEKVVNITEPLTLYAKWTPNNYTITLNTVGGEISKNTATVTYDSNYTLEVPTRLGYTFLGWYDGTGNSAVAYTDETGKSLSNWTLTEGKTLYAKWKAIV